MHFDLCKKNKLRLQEKAKKLRLKSFICFENGNCLK